MTHDEARLAVEREFSAGEPLSAAVAEHVSGCAECRAVRERWQHVDAALAKGGLGQGAQDSLEAKLFARLGVQAPVEATPAPTRSFGRWVLGGLVAAAAAVALFFVTRPPVEDEFTPRGQPGEVFGVRAFCVESGRVVAEAREGQTLACGPGRALQVSYSAARQASLSVWLDAEGGDSLFPREGESAVVKPGVDVPLSFSTPVGSWLERPRTLRWRFSGEKPVEGALTLTP